jgi:hypothetical protein
LKPSSEQLPALTPWMWFQSSMSAIETKLKTTTSTHNLDVISEQHVRNWIILRTTTSTHNLDVISEQHVRNWNQVQNNHQHSLPGCDSKAACQELKSSSEQSLALTPWMWFQSSMSGIEIKFRTTTSTHSLNVISK